MPIASLDKTDIACFVGTCCICQERQFLIPSGPFVMFKLCIMQTREMPLQSATIVIHIGIRDVTRTLIAGGGCLFICSCSARRISFEFKLISKEIRGTQHKYMNKHPPPPNYRSSYVPDRYSDVLFMSQLDFAKKQIKIKFQLPY